MASVEVQILEHIRAGHDCPDCDHELDDHGDRGCTRYGCLCVRSLLGLKALRAQAFPRSADREAHAAKTVELTDRLCAMSEQIGRLIAERERLRRELAAHQETWPT